MFLLVLDVLVIFFVYWLLFNLWLDFKYVGLNEGEWLVVIFIIVVIMLVFVCMGFYCVVICYIGIYVGLIVLKGVFVFVVFMICLSFFF